MKMPDFKTFTQFQKQRKGFSYTAFLFKIIFGSCFDEESMSKYHPGLRKLINHGSARDNHVAAGALNNQDEGPHCPDKIVERPAGAYK